MEDTTTKEVSGIRLHRNYIWLVAAVLVGLFGGAAMLLAVSHADNATLDDIAAARAALKSTELVPVETPDTTGFSLNILTETVGETFFRTDETDGSTLSARIRARDAHLAEETGATVTTTSAADFVQAAQADILSGDYKSNLYVADAANSLSRLLSATRLRDMTDDLYLRTDEDWFCGTLMDSLRIGGKRYLLSSSAVDARLGAVAVVYDRRLLASLDGVPDEGADLAAVALDGGFTLEYLLAEIRTANAAADAAAAALDAYGVESGVDVPLPPRGLIAAADDLFAVFFGIGGNFIAPGTGETVPYETFSDTFSRVLGLYGETSPGGTAAFRNGGAIFTISSLAGLADIGSVENYGILPLPKLSAADNYRTYIELHGTAMAAIPAGVPDADKVSYLFERMSFLSRGYVEPTVRDSIAAGNADDARVLALIFDGADGSVTDLFGYGDIPGFLAAVAKDGTYRLEMEFYKRKTLCEKALSIVAKRLNPAAAAESTDTETK